MPVMPYNDVELFYEPKFAVQWRDYWAPKRFQSCLQLSPSYEPLHMRAIHKERLFTGTRPNTGVLDLIVHGTRILVFTTTYRYLQEILWRTHARTQLSLPMLLQTHILRLILPIYLPLSRLQAASAYAASISYAAASQQLCLV
jgi:hypothetical protein